MDARIESLGLPATVGAGLERLRDDLRQTAGNDLVSLAVYGGLARKRYFPDRSDINLFLVLRQAGVPLLQKLAPILHQAWRSFRVEPLLITPDELAPAARDFPIKFLDIKNHHVLLAGDDLLGGLTIAQEHIRLRLEQELRNMTLRLRRRFLGIAQSPAELTRVLQEAARPLAIELASLLHLQGHAVPEDYLTASIFAAAAKTFEFDAADLATLAGLRTDPQPLADPAKLYERVLTTIAKALAALGKA